MWAQIFGFVLSGSSMITIPAYAIYYLCTVKGDSLYDKIIDGFSPHTDIQEGLPSSKDLAEMKMSNIGIYEECQNLQEKLNLQ
uniref:Aa_trans domain-containing protein n=1 Tax=Steinernema glaseri TaxID=37863 RepID=A0A1I7Y0C7_9BILA